MKVLAKKHYFYQKKRKDFVPVDDELASKVAKDKLEEIYLHKNKYKIPNRFIENWDDVVLYNAKGNIDKANALFLKSINSAYDLSNPLNDLTAKEWLPETITVFSQKGLGAGNKDAQIEKQHPAPFSFQDVARHIKFFTKEGDKVLDPFLGVGSTLKACCFEKRLGYGIELNDKYAKLSKRRIEEEVPEDAKYRDLQTIIQGDCREKVKELEENYFDFIITSPPYWNILETKDHKANERVASNLDTKYSEAEADLGNIDDYEEFLDILSTFFSDCSRILKKGKYMAVIVSDFRKLDRYFIFHSDLAKEIERKSHFKLKGIKILYQRHKSIFPYGYPYSFVPNVHHQNVLIFQNSKV
ncbi:MAG: DNA methyltransferase [Christiangramia sp.]|uniref:DNA methyltransferase n=1 Tax=Christiangramia sp. TaxID=1931228 RepID=UPI0032420560